MRHIRLSQDLAVSRDVTLPKGTICNVRPERVGGCFVIDHERAPGVLVPPDFCTPIPAADPAACSLAELDTTE
jgi:hypothetical protein